MMNVAAKIAEINESKMSDVQKAVAMSDLKLKHYNEFLSDPQRELGTVYPGFPGDKQETTIQKVQKLVTETKKTKAAKTPAVKAPKKESKKIAALRIFQEEKGVRAKVMERFIAELGMSKAGASTYFYSSKALSA